MGLYDGVVRLHKHALTQLIENSSTQLTVRLAAPRIKTGVNPLYGDFNRENSETGTTYGPFSCLWYDALMLTRSSQVSMFRSKGMESTIDQLAGQYREADIFAELVLRDVLVNQNDPYGLTYFDQCQNVIANGKQFNFLGQVKFGLATSAPYILVVALQGAAGLDD